MSQQESTSGWTLFCAVALLSSIGQVACLAHDMFLVVPDHQVASDALVTVSLYNGTFDKSENVIDRDRMLDISVADGEGNVSHPAKDQWREDGTVTLLDFQTGEPGTYVVGVSTAPKMIELSAEDFNDYLKHDGVLDVLEQRKKAGQLDLPARERYSKHIKVLLQAGGKDSDSFSTRLGYPIEIVPLENPADLSTGDSLEVLVLHDGEPAANQLVHASYAGYHSHDDSNAHREAITVRTDDEGKTKITLTQPGRWYVRLIRMLPAADKEADYESNWATLTFEIGK